MNKMKYLVLGTSVGVALLGTAYFANNVWGADDGIPVISAGDSSRPRMDVVDISSHQGNVTVGMFNTMKKYGVKMIIVKLSEGNYYRNPYAAEQIANARAAGLRVGGLTTTLRIQRQAKPLLKQIILLIQHKALA
ncbi:hypothetical protein HAU08_00695 [Weissella confusa]|nr:hypothetical protein [Weissella confusa]